MHDRRSEDDDEAIVSVRRRDTRRWNAAADTVEKTTLLAKAAGWLGVKLVAGIGFLLMLKQYMGIK